MTALAPATDEHPVECFCTLCLRKRGGDANDAEASFIARTLEHDRRMREVHLDLVGWMARHGIERLPSAVPLPF